jgi:hypothetical protein
MPPHGLRPAHRAPRAVSLMLWLPFGKRAPGPLGPGGSEKKAPGARARGLDTRVTSRLMLRASGLRGPFGPFIIRSFTPRR